MVFIPFGGGRSPGAVDRPRPDDQLYLTALTALESQPKCKVGVVDTGFVPHEWFHDRVQVDNFADLDTNYDDPAYGHGTAVAGIILLQAPDANVIMKGPLNKSDGGAEDFAVASAIFDLCKQGVELINLSFDGGAYETELPRVIAESLDMLPADTVVVVSAGDASSQHRFYPAGYTPKNATLIAVGAASAPDTIAEFSNSGPAVRTFADGVNILTPWVGDGFARWDGTSFSAAIVTGLIARMMAEKNLAAGAAWTEVHATAKRIQFWDVNGGPHDADYLPRLAEL